MIPEIALFVFLGGTVGFSIGLTSIGGAVFILPVLTVAMGFTPSVAVGTASLYSFLSKIFAGIRHHRLKHINYRAARLFLYGAIPGNLIVAVAINRYIAARSTGDHAGLEAFQHQLKLIIIGLILVAVVLMALDLMRARTHTSKDERFTPHGSNLVGVFIGLLVGAVIGATAMSSVVVVPAMMLYFRLSARNSVGTTVFVGLVLTMLTAVVYFSGKQLDWLAAVWMSIGSGIGVYFGSRLTSKIPERPLKIAVLALVAIAAIIMIVAE